MTKARVLIVEDEVILAQDFAGELAERGYMIVGVVATGEKALECFPTSAADVVLMDIRLAGPLDGIETANLLRQKYGAPVVFMSAYSSSEIVARAKEAEPFSYLIKPIDVADVCAALEIAIYKAALDRKLRESEERFRTFADFTYDWEYWVGPDRKFIHVTPSCERISGRSPREFMDNPDLLLEITHPEDRNLVNEHFKDFAGPDIGHFEFRITDTSGQTRWIEHYCQPVFSRGGAWLGRRVSNRDITVRKRLLQDLEEALREVKTLRGFIPICASCKKIRDDEGYWQSLEKYIQDRSDATFSHGICPDCARRLYPDFFSEHTK